MKILQNIDSVNMLNILHKMSFIKYKVFKFFTRIIENLYAIKYCCQLLEETILIFPNDINFFALLIINYTLHL